MPLSDELHVMCVMLTVEIGGIFTMWFDSDGSLQFETEAVDADAMYALESPPSRFSF